MCDDVIYETTRTPKIYETTKTRFQKIVNSISKDCQRLTVHSTLIVYSRITLQQEFDMCIYIYNI